MKTKITLKCSPGSVVLGNIMTNTVSAVGKYLVNRTKY